MAFSPLEAGGSSPITVFRPMEEMSLSCSLSDSMLVHSVSTMVSTWYSFTLLTRGPKLRETNAPAVTDGYRRARGRHGQAHHLTARFCTSPFLSSSSLRIILTTCQSKRHQQSSGRGPAPTSAGSTHLALAVVVQFDGIFLQLRHQVVGGHEPADRQTGHMTRTSKGGSTPPESGPVQGFCLLEEAASDPGRFFVFEQFEDDSSN